MWRDHLGLNQQQFADLLKMNIGTLRKYELSINLPGSEALAAFGTTGVSLDWLVLGRGVSPSIFWTLICSSCSLPDGISLPGFKG